MRTVLIGIAYIFIIIISLPLLLIECVVRKINEHAAAVMARNIAVVAFHLGSIISGVKKTVIGADNIPKDTPVLYAANHRSFFDILAFYTSIPSKPISLFVAKKQLKKMFVIAQWMYFINCRFIDRDDIKQQLSVIIDCTKFMKKGYSVYIAPEGTRNATDTLLPFKSGSLKPAVKTNSPIIPVCVLGTEHILEEHMPWIHKGHVIIEFGEPVYVDQLDPEQKKHIGTYIEGIVAKMYEKNLDSL